MTILDTLTVCASSIFSSSISKDYNITAQGIIIVMSIVLSSFQQLYFYIHSVQKIKKMLSEL